VPFVEKFTSKLESQPLASFIKFIKFYIYKYINDNECKVSFYNMTCHSPGSTTGHTFNRFLSCSVMGSTRLVGYEDIYIGYVPFKPRLVM